MLDLNKLVIITKGKVFRMSANKTGTRPVDRKRAIINLT